MGHKSPVQENVLLCVFAYI
jgi:hypothetical protein